MRASWKRTKRVPRVSRVGTCGAILHALQAPHAAPHVGAPHVGARLAKEVPLQRWLGSSGAPRSPDRTQNRPLCGACRSTHNLALLLLLGPLAAGLNRGELPPNHLRTTTTTTTTTAAHTSPCWQRPGARTLALLPAAPGAAALLSQARGSSSSSRRGSCCAASLPTPLGRDSRCGRPLAPCVRRMYPSGWYLTLHQKLGTRPHTARTSW